MDYRQYLPIPAPEETLQTESRINTIQDVVDELNALHSEIRGKGELSDKELKYYKLLFSDWSKHMIAAIKERDSHSPEIQAKQLEDQLRIMNGARNLSPARMLEILTSRNFAFSLEQYVVDAEVIEAPEKSETPQHAIARLEKSGINLGDYFDSSGAPKNGLPEEGSQK